MSIFSGFKKRDDLILVFNIGSSYVEGTLFIAKESGVPEIVFSTKEDIVVEKDLSIDRLLFFTIKALNVVAKRAFNAHLGAPSKIFCVLSSPWYFSQARIINYKKNTPFVFTNKLADSLIKKERNFLEEEYITKNVNNKDRSRIIEFKNVRVTLNGYETNSPLNQKVKELEIFVFVSFSGEDFLKRIENTVADYFNFESIIFNSFTLASFSMIRDMHMQVNDFLLVDIGGEVTDISMTKSGALRELSTFPLGRNFLIREISSRLNITIAEAGGVISLLKDKHAEKFFEKKSLLIVDILKKEWLKKFQESLEAISLDISIPSTIYVVVDSDLADFFLKIIEDEEFSQYSLTESKFKVIFLDIKMLHGIASFEEKVLRDPSIVINTIYINNFLIRPNYLV